MKTLSSFISEHPEELVAATSLATEDKDPLRTSPASNGQQTTKWKSLRAVMAYYCSLRRIKRNVATPTNPVFSVPPCVLAFC